MKAAFIDYDRAGTLSPIIRDYLNGSEPLKSFYHYPFSPDSFEQIMADKKFSPENRKALVDVLKKQYQNLAVSEKVSSNIESLSDLNTYTVTTAHQPLLFTGRLYFVYKILSALHLAGQLSRKFPGKHFVPVYFMGSEDHDFEEINHIYLFGEKIEWQKVSGGPVGRMDTSGLEPLIASIEAKLSNQPHADELCRMLKGAYAGNKTLADATLHLVNELFGEYGLVVLIPDRHELKRLFAPVMEAEITQQVGATLAGESMKALESHQYKAQANPREINFFYLTDKARERLVLNETSGRYEVLNTTISFSKEELTREIHTHPERFSPNVFFRPLYQETILPNLAYIGGGGELAYWLEQKKIFDHFQVNFPMLVLRNSVLLIDENSQRKMEKAGIKTAEVFKEEEELVKDFVKNNTENPISLEKEKSGVESVFEQVLQKAASVDPSLAKAVEGQKVGAIKGLENLEAKILRAEKRNFETSVNQLRSLKQRLFPEGHLQERYDNFLPWYAAKGRDFIKELKPFTDPFQQKFLVLADL